MVAASVLDTAKAFEKEGAEFIHLVDLDGARAKRPVNDELIIKTANSLSVPVEVGGGIRTMENIDHYLSQGVERVILGTSALTDRELLQNAVNKYGKRIAVGIDAKDGKVCVEGWEQSSNTDYLDFAKDLEKMGVQTVIFTDISKDGTLQGPNLEMLKTWLMQST